MRVTLTAPVVHRCPYADELDVGTVYLEYELNLLRGDAPIELYDFAARLRDYANLELTHEQLADDLAAHYTRSRITVEFMTAGVQLVAVSTGGFFEGEDPPCSG